MKEEAEKGIFLPAMLAPKTLALRGLFKTQLPSWNRSPHFQKTATTVFLSESYQLFAMHTY